MISKEKQFHIFKQKGPIDTKYFRSNDPRAKSTEMDMVFYFTKSQVWYLEASLKRMGVDPNNIKGLTEFTMDLTMRPGRQVADKWDKGYQTNKRFNIVVAYGELDPSAKHYDEYIKEMNIRNRPGGDKLKGKDYPEHCWCTTLEDCLRSFGFSEAMLDELRVIQALAESARTNDEAYDLLQALSEKAWKAYTQWTAAGYPRSLLKSVLNSKLLTDSNWYKTHTWQGKK